MSSPALSPFSPRAARTVGALGLASLVTAFALLVTPGDHLRVPSDGADGFSRSAIGHRGLVHLLRELGHDVRQQRSPEHPPTRGVLVLAEPDPDAEVDYTALAAAATRTLVVLPKRDAESDPMRPGWVRHSTLRDEDHRSAVLRQLAEQGLWDRTTRLRLAAPGPLQTRGDLPEPAVPGEAQLLVGLDPTIEPLVTGDDGVLLARRGKVHVLSDPDVLANHALADNAHFAAALFDLLADGRQITFDETVHGHAADPDLWHAIGSWPLVLVPAHLLLAFALVLWMARGRFGPALRPPPAIADGKGYLIDNVAALLRTSSLGSSLRGYTRRRVRSAALRLGAPTSLDDDGFRRWLLRRAARSGDADELDGVLRELGDTAAGDRRSLRAARHLHEITDRIAPRTHLSHPDAHRTAD
ncbi:MAG: DUF4350 domain-containing protein [Planctomycetota bacterium]